MTCLADETEVSTAEFSTHKREDVFQICKTLSKEDSNVGFELTITGLNPLMEQYQNIRIICRQGKNEKTVWEKPMAELKKEVGARTLAPKSMKWIGLLSPIWIGPIISTSASSICSIL